MIVSRPTEGDLPVSLDDLGAAARERWGAWVTERHTSVVPNAVLTLEVEPPGEPEFTVEVMRGPRSINLDGTPVQNYATAAWLRSLMPADAPRVIVFDDAWSMHADLTYGCTAEGLRAGTVDHSVPGWDAGDPDLY